MLKHQKILFMGTPTIAATILRQLIEDQYEIIGVITQVDKCVGRKQLVQFSPVKELAIENDIPLYQYASLKNSYHELLSLDFDFIITCAYGQMVPDALLQHAHVESLNVHASLLPKYRGGAPVHRAIMNNETQSGVTIMKMVKKMDAGDIIMKKKVVIDDRDTTGSLMKKIANIGRQLIHDVLLAFQEGNVKYTKQEESKVSYALTIKKDDEIIHFDQDVRQVYNHIRALLPAPVAYAKIANKKLKFHDVKMQKKAHNYNFGEMVAFENDALWVAARNGLIAVYKIQMEGKAIMSAHDFYNGAGKNLIHKQFSIDNTE